MADYENNEIMVEEVKETGFSKEDAIGAFAIGFASAFIYEGIKFTVKAGKKLVNKVVHKRSETETEVVETEGRVLKGPNSESTEK